MAPKLVVHRQVTSLSLIDAFPGGQMLDLSGFPGIGGPAVSGVFRNLGTEPETEVRYPVDEIKFIIEGDMSVVENGRAIKAGPGDAVFFPAGSVFTILPTVFTAFYVSARPSTYTRSATAKL